jgi:hypothetical protein
MLKSALSSGHDPIQRSMALALILMVNLLRGLLLHAALKHSKVLEPS